MEAEENTDVPPARIVLGMALFLIVLVTVVGNALVLAAVAREKRLQTAFNVFIVNLALTDVSVGLVAGFFAVFNILQTWPFGRVLCGIWIFCDFGMTLASIFTLLAISVHRYWSVYWGFQYRLHNSRRKAVIATVLIWTVMLLLWVPTFTVDRLQNDHQDGQCFYDPAKNKVFVAIVAIVGYHGSTAVMLFCYVKVLFLLTFWRQE
nr:hypothetical protein BaRGS_034931 [Batillaria attramentaria]